MASVGTIKYKNGSSWIDILHPVNSFYISYASTSPANLFGGTWTQITNAVIRGAASRGYVGSDTHTLTVNEMPQHAHETPTYVYRNGSQYGWLSTPSGSNISYAPVGNSYHTGGGAAHSIVQRSFNCYIWYRTA